MKSTRRGSDSPVHRPEKNPRFQIQLDKWLNYEWILENYHLYVYPRPGYDATERKNHPHVTFVEAPQMQLSSTMIRDNIRQKKSVRYMLPPKVWQYLDEMGFYEN